MTRDTWRKAWAVLGSLYPNAKQAQDEAAIRAYWTILEPYMDHEVERAVNEHARSGTFFPAAAELVKRIAGHRKHLGNDWGTVEAKLKLEAAGMPVPAMIEAEGPDRSMEVLRTIPRLGEIGTRPSETGGQL